MSSCIGQCKVIKYFEYLRKTCLHVDTRSHCCVFVVIVTSKETIKGPIFKFMFVCYLLFV